MTLERFKTIILSFLVLLSIVMSAAIWTYAPQPAVGDNPRSYGPPDPSYGPVKRVDQIISPSQMVIHFGGGKHTVVRPFGTDSAKLLDAIKDISIYTPITEPFSESDWEKTVNQKGLELDFSMTLTSSLLHHLLSFAVVSGINVRARTVYITETAQHDGEIWLFNGIEQPAYHARITINSSNLDSLFAELEEKDPAYSVHQSMSQSYYLPVEPLTEPVEICRLVQWNGARLAHQFFDDPFLAKRISDTDGVSVYSDGSIGVTIDQKGNTLTYENSSSTTSNFDAAVPTDQQIQKILDFVHGRGDLPGDWLVYQNDNIGTPANEMNFMFKQYMSGFPIDNPIGFTRVTMVNSDVGSLTRSLQEIGTIVNESRETILSAAQLYAALGRVGIRPNQVTGIYLGYGVIHLSGNQIKLTPIYVVEIDGLEKAFDAGTGLPFVVRG